MLNDLVPGGAETATANYRGWFISPELAYGVHYQMQNGIRLTPTARVRYVASVFDGFTESGSAQNLIVNSRTLQNIEERGELDVSKTMRVFGGDRTLRANMHGGLIASQRIGSTTINSVLIGQNLSFETPGKSSTVGAVAGIGFDYQVNNHASAFAAFEGIAMSDHSRSGSVKGGLRVAF